MNSDEPLFVTWNDDKTQAVAFEIASKAMNKSEKIIRTKASNIFRNADGFGNGVRDGFSRNDYNVFRPEEAAPTHPKEIIKACRKAYRKIGLINNIVNLMSDFTTQGISLAHPNRRIAKFMNEWWDKVNGREVSGKFAKNIFRDGLSVVQRTTAKLRAKDVDNLQKGFATAGDVEPDPILKLEKNEIPWKYTFLNPLTLTPVGDDLAIFSGDNIKYKMEIPKDLMARIKNPQNEDDRAIVSNMPIGVVESVKKGSKSIPLDPKKVFSFHYKKDDWELWADPMLCSVLDDLTLLNKMKLADSAALDGAISHIRIWKLGSLEHKILPTAAAYEKLSNVLLNNMGGGTIDLIWTPDISLEETGTNIHKFLGESKYGPTLNAIYAGLGIPPTLTGGTNAAGFTNNYISIQTLLERLNYVRMALVEFWNKEIKIVQRAMGFRFPAQVKFDQMTLTDKNAEKNILIQLYDRNVITLETLQELIEASPEIERVRSRREQAERKAGRLVRKAGPWNNPEQIEALQKIALQTGTVAPSQVGLELAPKKAGEKSVLDIKAKTAPNSQSGQPQQGRPGGSKDSQKRKNKIVKTRVGAILASNFAWASRVQKKISVLVDPIWLQATSKSKLVSLSDEESDALEKLKFATLCSMDLYSEYSDEVILNFLQDEKLCIPSCVETLCKQTVSMFVNKFSKEPSLDESRQIWASAYALYKGDY